MHTWVRRGLQTALVTGGLLMLGTGIASADENANPDQQPGPIDATVTVPIDVAHNALGTPLGQRELPTIHRTVSVNVGDLTNSVPGSALVNPVLNPLVRQAQPAVQALTGNTLLRDNRVQANIVAPVEVCGNAIAAGGDVHEAAVCDQTAVVPGGVQTNGDHRALAGNVVAANGAIPTQITGNAISAVGDAFTRTVSHQTAATGGDIRTSGDGGTLSGTISAVQWATPLQVANNAIAGAGDAGSNSIAESDATSAGSLRTSGKNGTAAGTIAGMPTALPVQFIGNGISGAGNASTTSSTTSNATAGTTNPNNIGLFGHATWAQTDGNPSTASGNVVQPQLSGPLAIGGNASTAVGNAASHSVNNSTDTAGGLSSTTGSGATGSGNFVDLPVALPSSTAGNTLNGIGQAAATHVSNINSAAGGDALTNGDNSTLSANTVNAIPAGSLGACGIVAGATGGSSANCDSNVNATSGGYDGTTGNAAVLSGNMGNFPVALPADATGSAVSVSGGSSSTTTGNGNVTAGGTANTADDDGVGTSNLISAPLAIPAQVFGTATSVLGQSGVNQHKNTITTAGGDAKATGRGGTAAGNILFVPASVPTQAFGAVNSALGNGSVIAENQAQSTAGGDALSNGAGGVLTGNVTQVPGNVVNDVFGEAANATGISSAAAGNTLVSKAGGATHTTGDDGTLAGNVLAEPATVADPVLGDAVTAGGKSFATGANNALETTGGESTSSGLRSSGSGNVLSLPLESDPDVFGDAAAALGNSTGIANNASVLHNGGTEFTRGSGLLNARTLNDPVAANVDVTKQPVDLAGKAVALATNHSIISNGPLTILDGDLPFTSGAGILPQLPGVPDVSELLGTVEEPSLGDAPFLPSLPGSPSVSTQDASEQALPGLPALPALPVAPQLPELGQLPGLGQLPVPSLPSVPSLPGVSGAGLSGAQLPSVQSLPGLPLAGVPGLSNGGVQLPVGSGAVEVPVLSGVLPIATGLLPKL